MKNDLTTGPTKANVAIEQKRPRRMPILKNEEELEIEIARMDYEARIKSSAERMRFQHETGLAVSKSVLLVNGGAIVSLLTFIGNKDRQFDLSDLRNSFLYFSIGIACSLFAMWLAYTGQDWLSTDDENDAYNFQQDMKREDRIFGNPWHVKLGSSFMMISVTCILLSVAAFVVGSFSALDGILK